MSDKVWTVRHDFRDFHPGEDFRVWDDVEVTLTSKGKGSPYVASELSVNGMDEDELIRNFEMDEEGIEELKEKARVHYEDTMKELAERGEKVFTFEKTSSLRKEHGE